MTKLIQQDFFLHIDLQNRLTLGRPFVYLFTRQKLYSFHELAPVVWTEVKLVGWLVCMEVWKRSKLKIAFDSKTGMLILFLFFFFRSFSFFLAMLPVFRVHVVVVASHSLPFQDTFFFFAKTVYFLCCSRMHSGFFD